uniref:Rab-GAP TBC domain-containing protein n=3 Tax=Clastoptera arizonana TaxID=38151 RepID=A0A1B6DAH4_9HEMI
MAAIGQFGYQRDAVRVKVIKCEDSSPPEFRKFSVDPQITSFEVLQSILVKAFDIKGDFTVRYRVLDDYGQEAYIALLSDWDLDAALVSASEPHLYLRIDTKPFIQDESSTPAESASNEAKHTRLQGIIMNQVERTFNIVQRALNLMEEQQQQQPPNGVSLVSGSNVPPRLPLTDAEFRQFLDPLGQVIRDKELRANIYFGGIEPSLRKVAWKHILNVYPEGMSGKERMDYMKKKCFEYYHLRDSWREMLKNGQMVGDLAYVTSMVRKDVLRTDRHHVFYAGSDDNKNIASLFNILTTYALNHPAVSYCQGMSDLASPLLVTMNDEAHAYICFCALMRRLSPNFLLDGITMTQKFQHLAEGLLYYDHSFYMYLKSHQADDLLFCYRWLLLEMKREFAFDDALRMLEVMWSSLPPCPPKTELSLFDQEFCLTPPSPSPQIRENPYTKVCALRRQTSSASLSLDEGLMSKSRTKFAKQCKARPYNSLDDAALEKSTDVVEKPGKVVKNLNEFLNFDKNTKDKRTCKKIIIQDRNEDANNKESNEYDGSSPDDSTDYFPMTTSMTQELKLELESLNRHVFGENKPSVETTFGTDDVFFWENPLPTATTPDEQNEIELDSIILKTSAADMQKSSCYKTSKTKNDVSKCQSNDDGPSLLERRKATLDDVITSANGNIPEINTLCEEVTEDPKGKKENHLPPPETFGGGNPFLMFLCITVLRQHRELIIRSSMDYNEMAMHFDKMVRKHDVNRVLNMARQMYAAYLKLYSNSAHLSI